MFLRSSVRRLARLAAILWIAPAVARAQFVSVTVEDATEEARALTAAYRHQPGLSEWNVRGTLVRIYRVDHHVGTVKINVVLEANTDARVAQGPTSQQSLRLQTAWSYFTLKEAPPAPPTQPIALSYDIPYDTNSSEAAIVFSTRPYAAACGFERTCDTIEGFLVFLLRDTPQLDLGGAVRPHLYQVRPAYLTFQIAGMSPLTNVTDVLLDGITMTRIPLSLNQPPGSAKWDLIYPGDPEDPTTPGEVVYPSVGATSVDRFLNCGGGGCGGPDVRLGLPADLGTGFHRITVRGSRWPDPTYAFYDVVLSTTPSFGEPAGHADLNADEDFIVVDPKISVSPPQAEPGSTITVTGTGFAPENQIPVRFVVNCCGTPQPLGTALTDVTGAFTLQATLPAAPFANVWPSSAPPGTTASGAVLAVTGDAAFRLKYGLTPYEYSASITFLKPGATASTTTTTTLPIACNPGDACDDGDPCTTDACTAGVCTHTPLTGAAAVTCGVPTTGLHPQVCLNETPPRRAEKSFRKATTFLERAINRTRRVTKRLFKKADKLLTGAQIAVDVAERTGKLSPSCADGIGEVIGGVQSRLSGVLSEL